MISHKKKPACAHMGTWTLCTALLTSIGLVLGLATISSAQPTGHATTCRNVTVPVQVGPQHGKIAGTLCAPPGADTVQVLVPGWTYDRNYYALPYKPATYSYARDANRRGYATLAIDRLGTGASLHPLSVFNTFNADVKTMHTVVQAARNGLAGYRFKHVVGFGHSLGSLVTASEAGQYHDVDALVTTGFTHALNLANIGTKVVPPGIDYPAIADPKFARSKLDLAYFTSEPGTRGNFYNLAQTDPHVVQVDERLKQTQTLVELADALTYDLINADRSLNVPVLDVVGSKDPYFCGIMTSKCRSSADVSNYERRWYGPHAKVTGYLVPKAGHDVQLERNAPTVNAHILSYLDQAVGHGDGTTNSTAGVQPHQPQPVPSDPGPTGRLLNTTFTQAIRPLITGTGNALQPIPGVGTQHADPTHLGDLLHIIGNLDHRLLGNLPAKLLSTV